MLLMSFGIYLEIWFFDKINMCIADNLEIGTGNLAPNSLLLPLSLYVSTLLLETKDAYI